jgi:gamma-glutamyltranspeptidase / glutathione hydrolase
LRRILFVVLAGLVVAMLSSCAQSTASENAPRENADEETTSLEEGTAGEEIAATAVPSPVNDPAVQPTQNTSTGPAVGGSGMVSSADPLATRAGLDILADGGNAFDAAVAVAASLGVVEPMMSGVGGYGAIVVYDAQEGETRFLDTGSRTPETLDPAAFRPPTPNLTENRCGAKAVATPGNVNAWETLSEDYGDLEWRRLFDPAIEFAEGGFELGGVTAGWIEAAWSELPEHAQNIYGNNITPLSSGDRLVQEDLGRSLRLIAEQGAGTVYDGELGEAIASTVRENDGYLTIDDLRNNRARWRDTIGADHRGYEVVTASPPATSWNALLRLGTMSQFDLQALGHNSVSYLHTFAEVNKQAGSAARDYGADPEIKSTPLDLLLSEEYWAGLAANVDPSRASASVPFATFGQPTRCPPQSYSSTYAPTNPPDTQGHTTHFVVADKEGNMVSSTQTLGNIFGSKVMPEGTGIWLNDAIAWSRFEPAGNVFDVFPGRQSLYALCPTLVMSEGRPVVALGTPGGRTISQTTPQMVANLIDFDMDIQQAIAAPRISFASPDALVVESDIPQSTRNALSALGHNVRVDEQGLGNAHGLTIEYDSAGKPVQFTGGADPRGEGAAAGR